jgi:hypothetical protein
VGFLSWRPVVEMKIRGNVDMVVDDKEATTCSKFCHTCITKQEIVCCRVLGKLKLSLVYLEPGDTQFPVL